MEIIFILLTALIIDITLGEPPNMLHPVAWLGKLISLETKLSPQKHKLAQIAYGISMVVVTLVLIVTPVYLLLIYLKDINSLVYIISAGILFKSTFALRGLRQAVHTSKMLLAQNKLEQARISLGSLVSRDTADLNESQLVSATIESATENSCDSFVAPLFYFLLFGVPGAIAYRIVNTFDAMVGYHGKWEYLGKFAARLDDVVNFLPARVTALLIIISAWICRKNILQAWHIMFRDHKKTQSPNAGWTMSAIAGALGVQLEKTGHYKLGDNHNSLSLATIDASLHMIMIAAIIWSFLSILAEVIYLVAT